MAADVSVIERSPVEMESVSCALCGGRDHLLVVRASDIKEGGTKEYNVVSCCRCGLAFVNPRPTKGALSRYYTGDDPEKEGRKPFLYERIYFNLFRRIPLRQKGALLDVGCGCGRYIYLMRSKGWRVSGVDIGHTAYGRDTLGLDIREGELSALDFADGSFDVVTLWWALEHMRDPVAVVEKVYRLLKKGGVLIVGVHNIASIEAKLFRRYWFHLFVPKHLYHFSPGTLTALLGKCGFVRTRIRHDLFSFGLLGSIQLYLNCRGVRMSLTNPFFYALSLPFDILLGWLRRGGLMTAYAFKD